MFRVPLIFLLASAAPLAAQPADSASMLRSGSTVRLLLRDRPSSGSVGAVLGRSGDTLRVITPEFGLAQVALDDLASLEVPASDAGKTAIVVAGSAAGGVVVGLLQGESFIRSLVLGSALAAVVVIPAGASERRRWRAVDAAAPWRDAPVGARVRVSAPELGFENAQLLLHDFRADSLYLQDHGVMKPSAVSEVTRLELSVGRDRRRGVRIGTAVGAIAAVGYGVARTIEEGEGVALIPVAFVSFMIGGSVGGFAGFLLAPRDWRKIPLSTPAPPRP
jgi:hypothetical protein